MKTPVLAWLFLVSVPLGCGDDSTTPPENTGGSPFGGQGGGSFAGGGGTKSNGSGGSGTSVADGGGPTKGSGGDASVLGGAAGDVGTESGGASYGGVGGHLSSGDQGGSPVAGSDNSAAGDTSRAGSGASGTGGSPSTGGSGGNAPTDAGTGGDDGDGGSGGVGNENAGCTPPLPPTCVAKSVACTSDANCGPTQVCDGVCRPAPAFGEPCTADWRCGDSPAWHRRSICDTHSKICVPPQTDYPTCVSEFQCPNAGPCIQGHCTGYISFYPYVARLGEDCSFLACAADLTCAQPSAVAAVENAQVADVQSADVADVVNASATPSCEGALSFPNRALEITIRNAIQVWDRDITATDVAALTSLKYLGDWKSGDLYGIECLTNLQDLELEGSAIQDLSRLSTLTQLKALSVHRTSVRDPSPLSGLSKLERLGLYDNSIDDFTSLKGLLADAPLTWLYLGATSIDNQCESLGDGLHAIAQRSASVYVNGCCDSLSTSSPPAKLRVTTYSGACALLGSGSVECWGKNTYGHLGNGTTSPIATPTPLAGVSGASNIGLNSALGCAVVANGDVMCWGQDIGSLTPQKIAGISKAKSVALADGLTCVLIEDGRVKCWGWNYTGGWGNGAPIGLDQRSNTPVDVLNISSATSVSAVSGSACASLEDGSVWCWGSSNFFTDGTSTSEVPPSSVPVRVPGVTNARSVHLGFTGAFAILNDGTVMGWNQTAFANGSITYGPTKPAPICGLSNVKQIAAGRSQTCARLGDGTVKCWGLSPLGDGSITGSAVPRAVPGITGAVDVSVGLESTCVTLADGSARCWGSDFATYPICVVGL